MNRTGDKSIVTENTHIRYELREMRKIVETIQKISQMTKDSSTSSYSLERTIKLDAKFGKL